MKMPRIKKLKGWHWVNQYRGGVPEWQLISIGAFLFDTVDYRERLTIHFVLFGVGVSYTKNLSAYI